MNSKAKFMKMYFNLPKKAKAELIYDFAGQPMSLNVVALEVEQDTAISKRILEQLGYG